MDSQPACAGGIQPPRPCISSDNLVPNLDKSRCVCIGGYYFRGPVCVVCEPGYYCLEGARMQCEMDTYMDMAGATACKPCVINKAAAEPCRNVLGGGGQLPYCDPAKPNTQNRKPGDMCVPCSQCSSRFYYKAITPSADLSTLTFCYPQFNLYQNN